MKSILACSLILLAAGLVRADAAKPNFNDDVLPVLKQACVACHSDDKQKGGLNLAGFAAAMAGGSSGAAVVPGKPDGSLLYKLASHAEEPKMPPKADKIPTANLEIIRKWIEQGARENSGSKVIAAAPAVKVALSTAVKGRPSVIPMPGLLGTEPAFVARRPAAVTALAASPWAPVVALGGTKQVLLYNADSGELLGVLPFAPGQVNSVVFSRNGKLLLAAGGRGGQSGKAVLYDLATGKVIIEVGKETDAILAADVSADQSLIAVGSPSKIVRIYSTADGTMVREMKKHTDWVTAVEFSPDGVLLATGDRNGGLFVWEAATGREFHSLRGPTAMITAVSWRNDANSLAASSEDGTIRLFEMENGTQTKSWLAHGSGVECVQFAHDGKLASTGRDKITKLWDEAGTGLKTFEAFSDVGLRAAITHDGSRVLASDWTGAVKVWTVVDGKLTATLDANPPTVAQRLQRAEQAVVDADAKIKQAQDGVAAAKEAFERANAEMAVFQKSLGDFIEVNKKTQAQLAQFRKELEKADAAVKLTQAKEAEAAKTLKAASTEKVKVLQADLDAAKNTAATALADQKSASEKFVATQRTAAATAAAVPVAQKKVEAEQAARKPVYEGYASAQNKLAIVQADAANVRKSLDKLKKK